MTESKEEKYICGFCHQEVSGTYRIELDGDIIYMCGRCATQVGLKLLSLIENKK